jgi:hypothetical protein
VIRIRKLFAWIRVRIPFRIQIRIRFRIRVPLRIRIPKFWRTDPRIRIRAKISRIWNTVIKTAESAFAVSLRPRKPMISNDYLEDFANSNPYSKRL